MEGHYELQLKDAKELKDEDFLLAIKENRLDDLLLQLDTVLNLKGHNLIQHWFPPTVFHNVFEHGIPDSPSGTQYYCNPLDNIGFMTTDSEPTYTESYSWFGSGYIYYDNIGSSAVKRFVEHRLEIQQVIVDPSGRESVRMRTRWLFLPSQAVSSNIRSLGIWGCQQNYTLGNSINRYQTGRLRFKDPATGNPVVINKSSNQALTFEYTIHCVSL